MIYFDAERIKHPHMGFFHFCQNLGKALAAESLSRDKDLSFFVPRGYDGYFGQDFKYIYATPLKKLIFNAPKDTELWHSSIQRSHYNPRNARILLTVHDMNYLHEAPLHMHRRYHEKYQESVDRAERIVTISQFAAKDIKENLDLKGKQVDVIYNGIPSYNGEATVPGYVPTHEFIYGIGSIITKRNFHTIPCILVGNDYELVLTGKYDDDVEAVIAEARKWGVLDRIHMTGTVSDSDKKWYLQHCAALVHPTLADGFGLPPVEAMQFGKPVFLSNRTSLPEIGGPDAFYFNDRFDPEGMREEFAKGMSSFNEEQSKRLIARAESFKWSTAASQYWDIYEEMLRG